MSKQGCLCRDLEPLWGWMGNHQIAVLVERNQFLIGPDERRLFNAAFLPVNFPRTCVAGTQNGVARLASAREIDSVANAHRVSVMQSQAVRTPYLGGDRLQSVSL